MIVHKPSRSLLLRVRSEKFELIRKVLPGHHKVVDYAGHNIAVPHNLTTFKILTNMGLKVPGPMRYYYEFPRPARFTNVFEHQYATSDFLTLHRKCFVLNEMGTSKTASACWAADYLMELGEVKRVLIVSPLSTLESVWKNELFDTCMHRSSVVLHTSADKRKERLARKTDFYIINQDGLKIIEKDLATRTDIDLIIVDEAADYRNGQTERYEVLQRIARNRRLWLLTGAPCPNAPTDAWALARLVDKTRVPQYFTAFKQQTMAQISQYKWVPKVGSHETAYKAMQPAIRFKKADCLTLPPVSFTNRKCDLTKEQTKAFEDMKSSFVAQAASGITLTAANAADRISKLRQILCGSIKDGATGTYHDINHAPRLKELQALIEQAAAKVLVIVPFKGIARTLNAELMEWHKKKGDDKRCAIVNGDVSLTERSRIFEDFRDEASLNELVCHPKVMSHGLTLTEADMVIFYAPFHSNDMFRQTMDRINRPGQTRKMTIVFMSAHPLETAIYADMNGRQTVQRSMLELYNDTVGA